MSRLLRKNLFSDIELLAYYSLGSLLFAFSSLLFPRGGLCALLIPTAILPFFWLPSLPSRGFGAFVFAPSFKDGVCDGFAEFAKSLAVSVESARSVSEATEWLLCPFCSANGYLRYTLDLDSRRGELVISCGRFAITSALHSPLRPVCGLPITVTDRPVRIKFLRGVRHGQPQLIRPSGFFNFTSYRETLQFGMLCAALVFFRNLTLDSPLVHDVWYLLLAQLILVCRL